MTRTAGESLLERFCEQNALGWTRIPQGALPTPDYEIEIAGIQIHCEVKQLEVSDAHRTAMAQLARGESSAAYWLGNRVRGKVRRVSRQLCEASLNGRPTLLVLVDWGSGDLSHSDVVEAMFGEIRTPVTWNASLEPATGQVHFGGQRAMTSRTNTSVSAVGLLGVRSELVHLGLYENPFARVPLDMGPLCRLSSVTLVAAAGGQVQL